MTRKNNPAPEISRLNSVVARACMSNKWQWTTGVLSDKADSSRYATFESITIASTVCAAAKELLYAYALAPAGTGYEGDIFYMNNGAAERLAYRGGHWYNGAGGGVFAFYGRNARSNAGGDIGGRSAFVDLP